jgi:hypothetical protein
MAPRLLSPAWVNARLSTTARRILRYLHARPGAQDTLEGILRWWLLDLHIEEQMNEVEAALRELAAADLVTATTGADGRQRYRVRHERRDEVRALSVSPETGDRAGGAEGEDGGAGGGR